MITFNKPAITGKELEYISQAIANNNLASGGSFTKRAEEKLEVILNCQKAFLTNSCTTSLELSAILCHIKQGDEVILPSYTFTSTANAFLLRGAHLKFVDIELETLNISVEHLRTIVSKKTKAIVVVHYAGYPCDIYKIKDIADENKCYLIEDAAQSLLSSADDKMTGTIGDIGAISFHQTKNIHCGEGGAILINNSKFLERIEILKEKGTNRKKFIRGEVDKYTWVDIGLSSGPSEITAAFLLPQLENIHEITERRMMKWNYYYHELKEILLKNNSLLPTYKKNLKGNGHIFYILMKSNSERNRLMDFLSKYQIKATFHYQPLHRSAMASKTHSEISLQNTEFAAERIIRLPIYDSLSQAEQDHVINMVKEFFR
jgi:dTDP-4-amino-4,6-dideoxygalactose transaminase